MPDVKPVPEGVAAVAAQVVSGHQAILAAIESHAEKYAALHQGRRRERETGILRAIMPAGDGAPHAPDLPRQ